MAQKFRGFVITDFVRDMNVWKDMIENEKIRYLLVGGEEKCPTTGNLHWHIYIYFENPHTFESVRKKVKPRYTAIAHGDDESNKKYMTKDAACQLEYGERPQQGSRSDLKAIKDIIIDKKGNMMDVINIASGYQALRTGELLLKYQKCTENRDVKVYWFWGDSGCGKTWTAIQEAGPDYWISPPGKCQWWDGYWGQETVILDELRSDSLRFDELLRVTDIYPCRIFYKGGSTWLRATKIYITSKKEPDKLYKENLSGMTEDMTQILRRITEIRHFDVKYVKNGTKNGTEVGGNIEPRPVPGSVASGSAKTLPGF